MIVAPAGFGKTRLATRIANLRQAWARCDVAAKDPEILGRRMLEALAAESPSRERAFAEARAATNPDDAGSWNRLIRKLWERSPDAPSAIILDNIEQILDDSDMSALVASLLACRPENRLVIICSRRPIPRELRRHALPHRTEYIGADTLRLTPEGAHELLMEAGATALQASAAFELTQGWPIAVQLMRRLTVEGRLAEAISDLRGKALDVLLDYLVNEYCESLNADVLRVLLLAAFIPNTTRDELLRWGGISAATIDDFLEGSPFVRLTHSGEIELHPLILAAAEVRYAARKRPLVAMAAAECEQTGDLLRSAEMALARGDVLRAATLLESLSSRAESLGTRFFAAVGELDTESITLHPALWLAASEVRRFAMPLDDLVAEARRIYYTLPTRANDQLRAGIAISFAWFLLHAGRRAEALDVVADASARVQAEGEIEQLYLVRLSILSMQGGFTEARKACEEAHARKNPRLHAQLLDFIEASTALRKGDYQKGIVLLEESVRIARRHGFVSRLLISLSNLAFEAWLAGDDERLVASLAEMRTALLPGLEPAWNFWFRSAAGTEDATPTGYEPVTVRSIGHLFLASARIGDYAQHAAHAVRLADESCDIALQIITRISAAERDPFRRVQAMTEALDLSSRIDIPEFRLSVEAYCTRSAHFGSLDAFVNKRLRGSSVVAKGVLVQLFSGRVFRDGQAVALGTRETAMLTVLAQSGKALSNARIADALWPEIDERAATNNIRVLVHKLRKKLGEHIVISTSGGYALGAAVHTDLPEIEAFVYGLKSKSQLAPPEIDRLSKLLALGDLRSPAKLLRFDWYVLLDHRISSVHREATLLLAREYLTDHRAEVGIQLLTRLIQSDATDEQAAEAVMRAYVANGDIDAARREMRRFAEASNREGDEPATRRLRAILEGLIAQSRPA